MHSKVSLHLMSFGSQTDFNAHWLHKTLANDLKTGIAESLANFFSAGLAQVYLP